MSKKQFQWQGCGILRQDFFLVDERLLAVPHAGEVVSAHRAPGRMFQSGYTKFKVPF